MRRAPVATVLVGALALAVDACGGGGGGTDSASSGGTPARFDASKPVTLTVWSGFTGRELGVWNKVLAGFHAAHPNVTIKSVGNIDNDKIVAAIRGGNPPDVALSF